MRLFFSCPTSEVYDYAIICCLIQKEFQQLPLWLLSSRKKKIKIVYAIGPVFSKYKNYKHQPWFFDDNNRCISFMELSAITNLVYINPGRKNEQQLRI